jgi:CheY-like chemotaxis protein
MPTSKLEIMLAEDDETDLQLMHRAFNDAGMKNPVRVMRDGQAVIDYLEKLETNPNDRAPALILLDLKMPRKDGLEVLQWIRGRRGLKGIPVVILSSSGLPRDVEPAYEYGASIYVVKPAGTMERAQIARLIDQWLHVQVQPLCVSTGVRTSLDFRSTWVRFREKPSRDH